MTKSVLGIVGGSGLYDIPALEERALGDGGIALGRAVRPDPVRRDRRAADPLPAAPRPRPQGAAVGHQLPRQHRRAEARRRHRPGLDLGVRLAEGGAAARALRAGRPVHRPHLRAREELLRPRLRRARVDGRSGQPAAGRCASSRPPRRRRSPTPRGGTYLVMEGPQFSTRAESNLYRSWGCDVIGMTNMPEAKLAREAEICYATVAMVTDYDCWHDEHAEVDVAAVIKVLHGERRQGARPDRAAGRATSRASIRPARSAPTARSTSPSSRRPKRAIRRS